MSLAGIARAGLPLAEVADLAVHLPDDGAVARARHIAGDRMELLRSMEFSLRVLRWQPTVDGSKGRNMPEPFLWPWEQPADTGAIAGDAMSADEVADWLGWTTQSEE